MSKLKRNNPYGEYSGNIFGWKLSLIGLGFILLIGGLAVYRHISLGVPFGMDQPLPEPAEMVRDSIQYDTLQ